ncbi:MAG: tetratricopeptide repeat protein [Syntrophobacteraceae bacterium]
MRIRIGISVLCILFLFVASGCSSKEEKTTRFMARGDQFIEKGDAMRAILEYKNALQLNPKNGSAYLALGKAYLAQKDFQQAFNSFRTATELDSNLDEARVEMAALAAASHPDMAIEELSRIVKPEPLELRIAVVKAHALQALSRHGEVTELLQKVREGEKNADVQRLLAVSFQATGNYKEMENAVEKSRGLEPRAVFSYLFLARFAATQGDKQRAARELSAMVAANQEDMTSLVRARALEELGMPDQAEDAYQKLPGGTEMTKAKAGFYHRQGKAEKAQLMLEEYLLKHSSDIEAVIALVQIFQAKKDTASSLDRIEKALGSEIKPEEREKLLLTKAAIKADLNERHFAIDICQEILKKNQGSSDAHFLLGTLLLNEGKTEEAEIHLNQATQARPNDPHVHILLARSQLVNKKDALAVDTLNSAVKTNPASNELRIECVRMLMAKNDVPQALKILDQGLELKPDNLVLLETRGKIQAGVPNYAKAEKDFQQLTRLAPDKPAGYVAMGQLMLAQSKPDKAIEWMNRVMALQNGWEAALPGLAATYEAKGDIQGGLALIQAEVAKRPASAMAQYILGQLHARNRNLSEAEKALARAVQLAPEWSDPQRAMAILLLSQGKSDAAIAELEQAYGKDPAPGTAMSLAMLYEQKGRIDDASRLFEEILRKHGQSPVVMNDLAYLYAEHRTKPGDLEKASNLAAQAVAKEPENPLYLDTAAWVAFKQGNLEAAWYRIQTALTIRPDFGVSNLHAAEIAKAKGDRDLALKYVRKALEQNLDPASQGQAMNLKKALEG